MTVDLLVLPWPAAIVEASGPLLECNARWQTRFGSCDDLQREFPEAAHQLRAAIEKRAQSHAPGSAYHASALVRAPGEIAPLRLRFVALPESEALWLLIVEENADELEPPARADEREHRDVELAMDGVAMRLQARNWRAFFHEAAAGKALIGLHGETLGVNRALCQLLDRSEHELLHLCARDLRHPDDRALVDEQYQSLLEGGSPIAGIEARYLHQDGHYLICLLALSLIRDSRQRPLYFAAEIEDISSRRQAEARLMEQARELERANSELLRSNAELERFAFVVSHDLQEPLRKIRVFGDRLLLLAQSAPPDKSLDKSLGADWISYVDGMTRAARRMQNLVSDLLAYGRLKQRDTPFSPVDLNALWDELRDEFDEALRESGAQLHVAELPTVRGNPSRLRQLFGNLLSNALKFRIEQPPRIEVRAFGATAFGATEFGATAFGATESDATASRVCIEVADNGIGFDQAHVEKMFEVCGRLHGRSEYPGTGIGLAICRRVAHEHGGEVRAFSRPGRGARFVVILQKENAES